MEKSKEEKMSLHSSFNFFVVTPRLYSSVRLKSLSSLFLFNSYQEGESNDSNLKIEKKFEGRGSIECNVTLPLQNELRSTLKARSWMNQETRALDASLRASVRRTPPGVS